jgi:hypothetical protein
MEQQFFFFWVKGLTWGSYAVHGPEEVTNAGDCIYVNYPSNRVTIFFGKGTFDHALLKRSQCCGAVPPVCRCCRQRFVGVRPGGAMEVHPVAEYTDPMGFRRPLPSNMSAVSIREQVYRHPQTLARRSPRHPGFPGLFPLMRHCSIIEGDDFSRFAQRVPRQSGRNAPDHSNRYRLRPPHPKVTYTQRSTGDGVNPPFNPPAGAGETVLATLGT